MFKRAHTRSDRSPLRRRLERAIQFAALLFFIVLGSAVYQNVSKGAPSPRPTRTSLTEPQSNNVGPSRTRPTETKSAPAGPHEPAESNAPQSDIKASGEGPGATGSTAAA